jgi:DNA-binding winged helix-turn-helix (wHTH) protein/serine/threonine protein kinase
MITEASGWSDRGPGCIWRFAGCEFDERRRELRVRGVEVDVEVKPLALLHQLLLHAGEVVTKTELLESVWPDVTVADNSLATAISKLRKLLGDDGQVIRTVPRVGYKLGVPVHCTPASRSTWPELHLEAGLHVPGRDQWQLQRRLDVSPSGEVWVAEHTKTRELRVFKIAADGTRLRGLKREVTVARLLREALGERTEFVRLLEWNFETPPYFIESEYGGPNLSEWTQTQGGLTNVPWEVRVKLLTDVARAVAWAHGLDLLHRDLKPGNILVAHTPGETPRAKVADFGSASLLVPERLSALGITNLGFTEAGPGAPESLTGTLMYVAPEVLTGHTPSAASDVYALGVLLYQLAVGDFRRPFAPGWEASVSDPFTREDIAAAAAVDPRDRLASAAALAERMSTLDRRRREGHRRKALSPSDGPRQSSRRRWVLTGVMAAMILAVAGLVLSTRGATSTAPVTTVAVLPFQNAGVGSTLDYLRVALPDEVATMLTRASGIAVRPFALTSTYDTAKVDIQKAGAAVRADILVTGRLRAVQDQLRVTIEAIDVAESAVLWRDTVEAPIASMVATHVQLALAVRGGLVPALGASVTDAMPEPRNEEAYELYLRSSVLPYDPGPNPQAVSMLQRAVTLDPTYAPAWLSLSRRYTIESHYGSGNAVMRDHAVAAADRAAELDPSNVHVLAVRAAMDLERGDLVGAFARAEDLVRREDQNVTVQFFMSYVLRYAGLVDESARHCEKAFLIDRQPVNTTLRSCGIVFFVRGDFTRAVNYLNLDRESEHGKAFWVDLLVRQGKTEAALGMGLPQMPQWRTRYEMLFACMQGRPPNEIAALARSVTPAFDPEANYLSAAHLSYCGQTDAAGEMLKRAIEGHYCSFPAMESDPLFANLRSTTGYAEIRAAGRACQDRFLAERASLSKDHRQ